MSLASKITEFASKNLIDMYAVVWYIVPWKRCFIIIRCFSCIEHNFCLWYPTYLFRSRCCMSARHEKESHIFLYVSSQDTILYILGIHVKKTDYQFSNIINIISQQKFANLDWYLMHKNSLNFVRSYYCIIRNASYYLLSKNNILAPTWRL